MSRPKRQLLFVQKSRKKRKAVIIIAEKVDGEKKVSIVHDPVISFRITKLDAWREKYENAAALPVVPMEDVEEVEVPYDELFQGIVDLAEDYLDPKALKDVRTFHDECVRTGTFEHLKKLHKLPFLHGSDVDLADHYHDRYLQENADDLEPTVLRKGYWDIEVDGAEYRSFPDPEEAPCPVNAISFYDAPGKNLYGFLLGKSVKDNPNQDEFMESRLEGFLDKTSERLFRETGERIAVELRVFETELDLIKGFFDCVHEEAKPDVLMAWNMSFDIGTLMTRLKDHHGKHPKGFFCDPGEIPKDVRQAYFIEDKQAKSQLSLRHQHNITSSVLYGDQMLNYMRIRVSIGGALESYSLDFVLDAELNTGKVEYDGNIFDLAYDDYERFVEYSLMDSFLLGRLDAATQDTESIHDLSLYTRTRFDKVLTKTVSLTNLARVEYARDGACLSNNRNLGKEDGEVRGSFRGGFVADPNLVAKVGNEMFGSRSGRIFDNVCDFDLASLYPSEIIAFAIDGVTQYGRIEFKDNEMDGNKVDRSVELADDLATRDVIRLGGKYFGLPGYERLLEMSK